MKNKTYRTCQNCGTVNLNKDYCQSCGEMINMLLKRRLVRENKAAEKIKRESQKAPNRLTLFFENAKKHKNIIVRVTAKFFYSVWVIVLAIGSFFAIIFGYIAA